MIKSRLDQAQAWGISRRARARVTTAGAAPIWEAIHEYDGDENGGLCATVTRKADLSKCQSYVIIIATRTAFTTLP